MIVEPVLLLGATGMLGRAWSMTLRRMGAVFDAPSRAELDLADENTLAVVSSRRWRMVVNCAAWMDVDGAEAHEEEAQRVNGTGVGVLARGCAEADAFLLHYSCDDVFEGAAGRPIGVGHIRNPVSAYGRSKALGEELIELSGCRRLIIRTSWIYAPWGCNFVREVARRLIERPVVEVASDRRGRPTSAEHLVRISMRLLEARATGTWHAADGGDCSRFELASFIASSLPGAGRVEAALAAVRSGAGRGPRFSVLDLSRTEARLGPMTDWRINLADVLTRLE